MPSNKEIELRSEEVQEILTHVPHWMIRWGNVLILFILVSILTISSIVEYPDIITANILITTQNPPEKIIARQSGKIEKILVSNNEIVSKDTPLAVIVNTANYKDVFRLKSIIDTLSVEKTNSAIVFDLLGDLQLGEVDGTFAVFEKDYYAYKLYKDLHPYSVENDAQDFEVIELQQRLSLMIDQKKISENELQLKKNQLNRYKKLYDKGVIATQEWDLKNIDYLQSEKNIRNLNSSISQIRSAINELDRNNRNTKINKAKDDINLLKNAILSFNQLKKAINEWELSYVLRSSIEGKVSFLQIWNENQAIETGETAFTVIPIKKDGYVGKIKAQAHNSGKIKAGQGINIRLLNYPDNEFGFIKGEVQHISLTPDKDGYLHIDVHLPDELKTSYNKKIEFIPEMQGQADIITDNQTLLQRLLYQFREIFSRRHVESAEANNVN